MKLPLFGNRKKRIFDTDETDQIVSAIRATEQKTSGEIRVFIERRCKYVDAIDRAKQLFSNLEMERTEKRNGVLLYVATSDHQIAIFADEGIHQAAGDQYWKDVLKRAIGKIKSESIAKGICLSIFEIGNALQNYFPYDKDTDKNELPDDIIFGN